MAVLRRASRRYGRYCARCGLGSTSTSLMFQHGPSNPHRSLTVAFQGLVFSLRTVQAVEPKRHLQHPLESGRVHTLSHATLPVEMSFESPLPVVALAFVSMVRSYCTVGRPQSLGPSWGST